MPRSVSFHSKLLLAFALLGALIVGPSALAWWGIQRSAYYDERAQAAQEVLDGHLRLAERGQRLLRHIGSRDARPGDALERRLRTEVDSEADRIRAAIAAEVALVGRDGADDELKELVRLDAIRLGLARAAADDSANWRQLLAAAVDEERREVEALDVAEVRIFRALKWLLGSTALAALLIGAGSLFALRRAIQRPVDRLAAGANALAGGDLSHRIGLEGDDEFAQLGRNFDRMADHLQQQSATIAASNAVLEQTVATRTEALRSANAGLANAADRRRRFLADISHELRTPLTIIRGEAEVTLRGADKPAADYRGALTRIADQARGMGRLVDDLLFIARGEAGEPKLELAQVGLGELLERAVADVRSVIESDNGSITLSAGSGSAIVSGDAGRLRQLVRILIDNAMRYSAHAPEIGVTWMPSSGGVTFRIADRGVGIPAAELSHVFDRYRRGTGAAARNDEGVGLGLPMAKAIVEAHRGTITLDSAEDRGTTVSVFLPGAAGLRAVA